MITKTDRGALEFGIELGKRGGKCRTIANHLLILDRYGGKRGKHIIRQNQSLSYCRLDVCVAVRCASRVQPFQLEHGDRYISEVPPDVENAEFLSGVQPRCNDKRLDHVLVCESARLNHPVEKSGALMKCCRFSILANKEARQSSFARRIAFFEATEVQNLSKRRESGFTHQKRRPREQIGVRRKRSRQRNDEQRREASAETMRPDGKSMADPS